MVLRFQMSITLGLFRIRSTSKLEFSKVPSFSYIAYETPDCWMVFN